MDVDGMSSIRQRPSNLIKIHKPVPVFLHLGRLVMPWQIFHFW